jgi:hypothetical protein
MRTEASLFSAREAHMTESVELGGSDPWFRVGAPDFTDLRTFHATGRRITGVELLLYVEADLELCDSGVVLFEEPRFGVAALAQALTAWVGDGAEPDHDFEHSPDGYEEPGVVSIAQTHEGWVAGSCFATTTTTPHAWETVNDFVGTFVTETRRCTARSLLDAGWSLLGAMAAVCRGFGLPLTDSRTIVLEVSGQEREFWAFQEQAWDVLETLADDVQPGEEIP